ncbi:RNA-directed DNA polymerase, eukaryota, reverse transcriptase zinc-binding domain protein [Tanacetum coccineum]|uniref:RNA-directed DNA polymerase, eukaryota, reverse transcriptase zinc-binding domain protein n=1 Tax=Tanacetum coccineum TaxID=301880 RepID=A0ABQ4ZHG0_9ASTR
MTRHAPNAYSDRTHFRGVTQETKMTKLELFQLKSMWGNFKFDYACSMARVDPGDWLPCGMLVCDVERFRSSFSNSDAVIFNLFIQDVGLIDLPMGGRMYTWMNKTGSKLSKLDCFLISDGVLLAHSYMQVTVLDRVWSDHIPILLHYGLEKLESMDLIQKDRVKWDVERDENSKFFHDKLSWYDSSVIFPPMSVVKRLCDSDQNYLDSMVSLEEIKAAVWDCGTGFSSSSLPFSYLGLPIGSNMGRIENCKVLIDHFKARLPGWKANLLSSGGRLTLIKSVLGSLSIYYLSIFKSLEGVTKVVDASLIRFWKDTWLGDVPLCSRYKWLYHMEKDQNFLIKDRFVNGSWSWE